MRRGIERMVACALALALCGAAAPAHAAKELYRYVAPDGVVHFTDRQKDDRYVQMVRPRGVSYG